MNRPTPGVVEDRTAPSGTEGSAPTIDGRKLSGLIPYGVESRDMGGWREVIDPGALDGADLGDLIATREHDRSRLLGRHPTTLTVEDRDDGFAWAVDLPTSPVGEEVRVAIERGDLRASSWRQVVARDYWDGDVRHIAEISHLLDVTVTAAPAYAAAAATWPHTETSRLTGITRWSVMQCQCAGSWVLQQRELLRHVEHGESGLTGEGAARVASDMLGREVDEHDVADLEVRELLEHASPSLLDSQIGSPHLAPLSEQELREWGASLDGRK